MIGLDENGYLIVFVIYLSLPSTFSKAVYILLTYMYYRPGSFVKMSVMGHLVVVYSDPVGKSFLPAIEFSRLDLPLL
jgi:hypothetical protein